MNAIELACAKNCIEIVRYFINELGISKRSDFYLQSGDAADNLKLEDMNFIFLPLLQKHRTLFEILINEPTLWSGSDLIQISHFLKQLKWREGFIAFYQSHSVKNHFNRLHLPTRFRYIRDQLMIPYELENLPFDMAN